MVDIAYILLTLFLYSIPVAVLVWFIISLVLVISSVRKKVTVTTVRKSMLIASSMILVGVIIPAVTLLVMFRVALSHM